ncbi:serine carboxypeptidase [Trifolium pratense]|uniref:Serine carboxypeptidase n=1 Tax=Trifolium pratense TaxID=57577 RepID=A0A2K3PJ58_TRIPR|nr:serine carboxypeptidase [Trifolium pratense]
MEKFSSCYGKELLLVLVLLSHISFQLATCASIVKFLPGFQGTLPFLLETGYVGVGENEDVQVFYYFIESENNSKDDPLMLWLTGGPGCSALSGLFFEIGPLEIIKEEYNGSLPNLILRPHSWTKVCSIIFVDLPVSTGFSYARTNSASQRSDSILVRQALQFFRKWLVDHPKFQSNEVYIGGDSYSGIPVPVIVQEIAEGNEKGVKPWINLQGYLTGNAATTGKENNYKIPFAHGMGLISDELYDSLQKNCNGDYVSVENRNVLCARDISSFKEATSGLNPAHILDPDCKWLDDNGRFPTRSLIKKYPSKFLSTNLALPALSCRSYPYFLCGFWANDDNVRKALHIRKGSIGKWRRCSYDIPHKRDIPNSYDYHVNLSRKGIRSLIYSGDHDMLIPFLGTQAWIRSLNYSIVDDWRQWHTNDQVAGYTRTYSNRMTFATVKGGGHTAPEYRPKECFDMFSRYCVDDAFSTFCCILSMRLGTWDNFPRIVFDIIFIRISVLDTRV